jgi:DNA-3-methyladenine glycosylase
MNSSSHPTLQLPPPEFYLDGPEVVARKLLGKLLIRRSDGKSLIGRIVETEAYLGLDDAAAHSFAGKTNRNNVLFGPPGRAYVYFIYGMHYCLNVSCEPEGLAGGVLFRALEPIAGLAEMARLRKLPATTPPRLLTSGPVDLTSSESTLQIADDGFRPAHIAVTPRIGIRKASAMPLRFLVAENKFVSASLSRVLPSSM